MNVNPVALGSITSDTITCDETPFADPMQGASDAPSANAPAAPEIVDDSAGTAIGPMGPTFLSLPGVQLTPTALLASPDLSYEQWSGLGDILRIMEGAVQWWIGDWCNAGEDRFSEAASQAIDATGWAYETIQQYARVAKRVAPERRVAGLSFSHHREVADLEAAEQAAWLAKAATEKWSTARLRGELKRAGAGSASEVLWLLVSAETPEDRERLQEAMEIQGRRCRVPSAKAVTAAEPTAPTAPVAE